MTLNVTLREIHFYREEIVLKFVTVLRFVANKLGQLYTSFF